MNTKLAEICNVKKWNVKEEFGSIEHIWRDIGVVSSTNSQSWGTEFDSLKRRSSCSLCLYLLWLPCPLFSVVVVWLLLGGWGSVWLESNMRCSYQAALIFCVTPQHKLTSDQTSPVVHRFYCLDALNYGSSQHVAWSTSVCATRLGGSTT